MKTIMNHAGFALLSLLLFNLLPHSPAWAFSYSIQVDTPSLSGTAAQLAFDFIDGGPPSNNVVISGFSSDGTLGIVTPTGSVSGTLPDPVALTDGGFFNEYLTDITLGTTFSFQLDATTNGPEGASLPDAFSLFLLDPDTNAPLFSTTDPTGAYALLVLNIDGTLQGLIDVYSGPEFEANVTPAPVPEPGSLLLLIAGSGLAFLFLKHRKRVN